MKKSAFLTFILLIILSTTYAVAKPAPKIDNKNPIDSLTSSGSPIIKTEEIIGYYWLLLNNGCFYLGRVVQDDWGLTWWEPLDQAYINGMFCCQVMRCMSSDEFETFC